MELTIPQTHLHPIPWPSLSRSRLTRVEFPWSWFHCSTGRSPRDDFRGTFRHFLFPFSLPSLRVCSKTRQPLSLSGHFFLSLCEKWFTWNSSHKSNLEISSPFAASLAISLSGTMVHIIAHQDMVHFEIIQCRMLYIFTTWPSFVTYCSLAFGNLRSIWTWNPDWTAYTLPRESWFWGTRSWILLPLFYFPVSLS